MTQMRFRQNRLHSFGQTLSELGMRRCQWLYNTDDLVNTRTLQACLIACLAFVGCSEQDSGPRKYPVQGQVLINDAPAERVAVTFHHADDSLPSNHRFATAVTNEDGRFALSTEGENDGALAGTYRVTFAWMSSPEIDGFDMLDGAFSNPALSEYVIEIPPSIPELPPFALSVPEDRIFRPRDKQSSQ